MLHHLLLQVRIVCQNLFQPDFQIVNTGWQGLHDTTDAADELRNQHGNKANHHGNQQAHACQCAKKASQPLPALLIRNDVLRQLHNRSLYPVVNRIQQIGKHCSVDNRRKDVRDFCAQCRNQ